MSRGREGRVPYKGPLSETVFQLVEGLNMQWDIAEQNINELMTKSRFMRITNAGLKESHHDIHITKEAPNYSTLI